MPKRPSPPAPDPQVADAYRLGRWFTAARREGFLTRLKPDEWQTLSAVLSFTSRDGRRDFTLEQLSLILAVSRDAARERLETLAATQWQDKPLGEIERDMTGAISGITLAPIELLGRVTPQEPSADPAGLPAEAAILAPKLSEVGLNSSQVEWIVSYFDVERIRRQLEWLPARAARNPAAMLIRAVEQNWGPPKEET